MLILDTSHFSSVPIVPSELSKFIFETFVHVLLCSFSEVWLNLEETAKNYK